MLEEKQTPTQTNEYEIGTTFTFVEQEPSNVDIARELILGGLSRVKEQMQLETRMFVYDALHGTQYRRIHHKVMAEERNKKFEESIGLERTK